MNGFVGAGRLAAATGAFKSNIENPNLRWAQLSFAGASTAEWALTVALGIVAFRDGGAQAVGLVSLLRMAPAALALPFIAPLADHWRRDRVLVAVSGVSAVATAGAAAVVGTGRSAVYVYTLAVLSTIAATLYRPAHSALLPSLCRTPYELASANVVRGMLDSLATLVGPALAAVLLSVSGVTAAFFATAAASALSALLLLRVRYETPARSRVPVRPGMLATVTGGIRVIGHGRDLMLLVGLTAVQTFTRGALTVLTVVVAIDLLGTGASGVGLLTAALGAGAVLGSLAASSLVGTRHLAAWFGAGVAMWGVPITLMGVAPSGGGSLVLLACIGLGNAFVDIGLYTLIARLAADAVLARVFAVLEAAVALAVGVGSIVTPVAIELLGLRGALLGLGSLAPIFAAAAWSRLRRLDQAMTLRERDIGLLRRVPMLQPLPLPLIEQLAWGLETAHLPAGATVFHQGAVGDRFYVVSEGVAEVIGDGRLVATLGLGDGFGEIALLRDVPRTATVRAATELSLQTLTSERFLPVLTGYSASLRRATTDLQSMLDRFSPASVADPSSRRPG